MGDQSIQSAFQQHLSGLLREPYATDDTIHECGSAPLSIIQVRPHEVLQLAHEKLHAFPYKDVPESWRRLYTEASLWKAIKLQHKDWISEVIKVLDMAVIMTGAPGRQKTIQSLLKWLQASLLANDLSDGKLINIAEPASGAHLSCLKSLHKRRKIEQDIPHTFPDRTTERVNLMKPLRRFVSPSLPTFEKLLAQDYHSNNKQGPMPFIITDALKHWPALCEPERSWNNPRNLLHRTLSGYRLVPVELGRSYTDEDWGQKIMTFREFLLEHMLQNPSKQGIERKTGYLAQHDLFAQVPDLRTDICIPDFCYASVPEFGINRSNNGHTVPQSGAEEYKEDDDDMDREVILNAWFGPAHTISPLHTDPHHNILAQVVGSKYVRLFAPSQNDKLYPHTDEGEVNMSNTSQVDIDLAMRLLEDRDFEPAIQSGEAANDASRLHQARDGFAQEFPKILEAEFVEGVLEPGDCLFIPRGWWHYIRSLSASCSVSFWWD